MKSCTDIEQSKKLANILPIESSDMYYALAEDESRGMILFGKSQGFFNKTQIAWSLAALLEVLRGTNISTPDPLNKIRYSCWNDYDIIYASNPVDACYEMIIRLNELNLL